MVSGVRASVGNPKIGVKNPGTRPKDGRKSGAKVNVGVHKREFQRKNLLLNSYSPPVK